jgi:hypothetical protein
MIFKLVLYVVIIVDTLNLDFNKDHSSFIKRRRTLPSSQLELIFDTASSFITEVIKVERLGTIWA